MQATEQVRPPVCCAAASWKDGARQESALPRDKTGTGSSSGGAKFLQRVECVYEEDRSVAEAVVAKQKAGAGDVERGVAGSRWECSHDG